MTPRLAAAVATALALVACNKEPHAPYQTGGPTGRFRFVNAAPDTASDTLRVRVDVYLAGTGVATNLGYRGATTYATVLAGPWPLRARKTVDTAVVVINETFTAAAGVDYTIFAADTQPAVTTLILTDVNTAPAGDSAKVRIVHASPGLGAVDVYITALGADLAAETPDVANVAFRDASAYFTVPIGAQRVRFTTPGTKTVVLDVTGTAFPALARGQIRTVVALDRLRGGAPFTFVALADR
ncbi:MAG TPA: DUF4397 domain-containing protein [Gemmatimonadales bacterium]|jgi:hypothetical protein|nr:DUF4397 domain-containing protein [Gemmatimonadales bacterium]